MKTQENTPDYSDFLALHKHQGTENYEVATVIPKKNEAKYFLLDTISHNLFIDSYFDSINNKDYDYRTLRIDKVGNVTDHYNIDYALKDGTKWDSEYYSNWIINGDTTRHKYKDPLSNDEKTNINQWLPKFKELYNKASYVYLFSSDYFFKINNEWYKVGDTLEDSPMDLRKQYPSKEDQDVRMVELPDLTPGFSIPPEKRDTSLIRDVGYKSMFFEKIRKGMDRYNYSAGYWYLELYMPLGDTVKIRRYSDARNPRLSLYKIPAAQGGRNDVVFVVLEPNEVHPEQAGGIYVVRPRDPNQPQHRYKSKTQYIYKGEVVSEEIIETEEYIQWKAKQKNSLK